ncbi:hypothetical protein FB567DRAFT_69267 [Paraphoma chrysanthemicola]|uniref:Homeobox domain-containing protein n=1 Tax=Paraphoma chrysanthemicola TaxID=798071 RepID=A0A8K0R6J6_9PLEO|nr:hypothetical protein FB567DRAFT_69267 [Paraphoma chrysanthemicola]
MAYSDDGSRLLREESNLRGLVEVDSTYISRNEPGSDIPTILRQVLERAFASNSNPSRRDLEQLASRTNLSPKRVHLWFCERAMRLGRISELSESTIVASRLIPPGPNSVEEDVQFASGWVDNSTEACDNSILFGNSPAIDLVINQQHDFLTYTGDPAGSYPIEPNSYKYYQHFPNLEPDNEPCNEPWHPGARYQLGDGHTANDPSTRTCPPAIFLTKDWSGCHVQETTKATSTPTSLAPPTVCSEAIGSRRSRSRRMSVKSQDDVTTCDYCGATFTGRYGRGNCSRHIRQQHSGRVTQLDSGCLCRVCKKQFNRQDARRKHEWKKHRLHDTRPLPRRQAAEHDDSSSHTGTNDVASDQGTLTCAHTVFEDASVERRYRIPDLSYRAHHHFALVKGELEDDGYDRFCEQFLAWCEYIVGELRVKQSDAQHVFARAVRDLDLQLRLDALGLEGLSLADITCPADADDDGGQSNNQHINPRQDKGKALARSRTTQGSSRAHPYSRQSNTRYGSDALLMVAERFQKPTNLDLDCPVYKWYLVHSSLGRIPPCNGCMEKHMNGVRQHLLPSYSQQHTRHVQYIKRCGRCTEDVIDESAWTSEGHENRSCQSRSQPRGMSLINWARLYLKIFPDEIRVPSPFRNDSRFLPDELVSRIQTGLRSQSPMILSSSMRLVTQSRGDDPDGGLDDTHGHDTGSLLRWLEEQLRVTASLDVLISRTSKLLQELKAAKVAGCGQVYTAWNSDSADHVEAEYRAHLHELRHVGVKEETSRVHNYAQQTSFQHWVYEPSHLQGQAPAIGSADFQLPQEDTHCSTTYVARSDGDTLPSTQDNYHGDASFGFPSGFGSSQTSYDFGGVVIQDKEYEGPGQTAPIPLSYKPSFLSPTGQWASLYDPRLDQAGPSDVPQSISAEYDRALLEADINQMFETSPSASPAQYPAPTFHGPDDSQHEPTPDWA